MHYIHVGSASAEKCKHYMTKWNVLCLKKTCKNGYIVENHYSMKQAFPWYSNVQNKLYDLCRCYGPVCLHTLRTCLFARAANLMHMLLSLFTCAATLLCMCSRVWVSARQELTVFCVTATWCMCRCAVTSVV